MKQEKNNAYTYCKFRDEQYALYVEYAKRHGILMKTLLTVNALYYNEGGMTQKQICDHTSQAKQTINLIISHLLDDGYVTVTEVPENKRTKIVRLTEEGRAWCKETVLHVTWAEETAMSMLSPEEQQTLIALSRKYTENFTALMSREKNESETR